MWLLILPGMLPDGLNFEQLVPEENNIPGLVPTGPMMTMPTQGSSLYRVMWLTLLGFGLAVIAIRPAKTWKMLRQANPFFLLFVAFSLASTVWSLEPTVTLRRCLRVLTVTADAVAFVLLARSVTNFQAVLRPILTIFLFGSIVFVLLSPNLAIEQLNQAELVGAWRGLAAQKNVLGAVAAIAVLLWLHAGISKEAPAWKSLLGLLVSAVCLVKSRSSTSLMAVIFASGLLLMLVRSPSTLRRYMPYLTVCYAALLLIYSLAVLNLIPGSGTLLSPIAALVGKDLTFSGRTAIWDVIRENIALHPLLGGGYGAYWTGLPNSPSNIMLQRVYFYPTESHNGYLDVYNDLGLVGELLLIGFILMYLRQGIRIYSSSRSQGALYLALLFMMMIGNLSEARWFNALNGDLIVMIIATMAMAKSLADTPQAQATDKLRTSSSVRYALRNPLTTRRSLR